MVSAGHSLPCALLSMHFKLRRKLSLNVCGGGRRFKVEVSRRESLLENKFNVVECIELSPRETRVPEQPLVTRNKWNWTRAMVLKESLKHRVFVCVAILCWKCWK